MKRPATSSRWLSAFALLAVCACGSQSHASGTATAADRESARIAPVVEPYKKDQVLTGFDIKGESLDVFADSEKLSELDDDAENAMKAGLLKAWVSAWSADHAGAHATLYVKLKNYYGQEIATLSKRV